MHRNLRTLGTTKTPAAGMCVRPPDSPLALNGSGLIVANPPWQFDSAMRATMSELHQLLAPDGAGGSRVDWLVPE